MIEELVDDGAELPFAASAHSHDTGDSLAEHIKATLSAKVPKGLIIDVRSQNPKNTPEYFSGMRVIAGDSLGTSKYQIEMVTGVQINAVVPMYSSWTCEATPIDPSTGQPTNQMVTLKGHLTAACGYEDPNLSSEQRFYKNFDCEHLISA